MKCILILCLASILIYHGSYAQSRAKGLDEKVQQLNEIRAKKNVIPLNLNRFKDYVKSAPRDYSFIVMFTAMAPSRKCAICHHVYEEFMVVADSYRLSPHYSSKMFFGVVDFDEGSEIFQMLRLNTAPIIMHFPAKGKPKPADSMDFERVGIHAEAIAKWVQDRTDVQIKVFRPPNYSSVITLITFFSIMGGFIYLKRNNLQFLYNRKMWAAASIVFCFIMVSGQMWNQIRGPPLYHKSKNGPVYINGGSHGQFVLESYFIAALIGAVVIGMILMIESGGGVKTADGPSQKSDSKKNRLQSVLGLILTCVFFSLILSVFRMKTQGYPYSFLFK